MAPRCHPNQPRYSKDKAASAGSTIADSDKSKKFTMRVIFSVEMPPVKPALVLLVPRDELITLNRA